MNLCLGGRHCQILYEKFDENAKNVKLGMGLVQSPHYDSFVYAIMNIKKQLDVDKML